jgi:hypothetical protein
MMVMKTIAIPDTTVGCDLNGDGQVDNIMGGLGSSINGPMLDAVNGGSLIMLFELRRLNDPTGQNDADLDVATYSGIDYDSPADPSNNFTGTGQFYVSQISLDASGNPVSMLTPSSVTNGHLTGVADDFAMALPLLGTLTLKRTHFTAPVDTDGTGVTGISQPAQLCGVVPACTMDLIPIPAALAGLVPVDTILELLLYLGGTQPDVDMDGDGLEEYKLGVVAGRHVLTGCTDGNGDKVALHPDPTHPSLRCPCDPRFVDGYSMTIQMTTVSAVVMGVQ